MEYPRILRDQRKGWFPYVPVVGFYELDADRHERRKVWVFHGRRVALAGDGQQVGTVLSQYPVPVEQLGEKADLVPESITAEQFEVVWRAALSQARRPGVGELVQGKVIWRPPFGVMLELDLPDGDTNAVVNVPVISDAGEDMNLPRYPPLGCRLSIRVLYVTDAPGYPQVRGSLQVSCMDHETWLQNRHAMGESVQV